MQHLWIYITLFAVLCQVGRNAVQKILKRSLDSVSITWSRFLFAFPIAILIALIISSYNSDLLVNANGKFLLYCFLASLTQIIGTILLVNLFSHRNFLIGITYMKTETMQTALLGALFFASYISFVGVLAIIFATIGLLFLSPLSEKNLFKNLTHKTALIGLASGFSYALAALYIKEAILLNSAGGKLLAAIITLLYMNIIQNLMLLIYQLAKGNLGKRLRAMLIEWRLCLAVGMLSISGSICWFYAFALTNVAYVKVVGQTEILLSIIISQMLFKEKSTKREIIGVVCILGGILLLIL
jgi:drug/metabolite transporter (DMT)-like permease